MPLLNRAMEMMPEISAWRRHLHQMPELQYDVHETAAFVAEKLRAFGCDEIATGIGRTGVVGLIHGSKGKGATIGLRADMDALPITEATGLAHASKNAGKMHACGHDGHTSMLLGAAQHLCETRNFAGSVAVIFQPAEEGGAGARAMVRDGMMEKFDISKVFGMHNMPGLDVGKFAIRTGAIMAATDEFTISVKGKGGHTAQSILCTLPRSWSMPSKASSRATPTRWNLWSSPSPSSTPATPRMSSRKQQSSPGPCAPCKRTCAILPKRG
jgi:amidohydrolase